jgi:hypothetical protein
MWRQGYTWEEIATRLHDPKPEALKKRFWRWIRQNFPQKSAKALASGKTYAIMTGEHEGRNTGTAVESLAT